MKKTHLITYLMFLTVITSCIKEDGQPYTIMREIDTVTTLISSLDGYMYGTVQKTDITKDTFELKLGASQIEDLDVYLGLKTSVFVYDTSHIKQCGYVYSYTNKMPTVGQDTTCQVFDNINWNNSNNHDSISFTGEQHKLKFNTQIYIRPFVVTNANDTCYAPKATTHTTSKPSNVWFKRKDPPALMAGREGIITATAPDGVNYFYGGRGTSECYSDMWVYNPDEDSWEQKATCKSSEAHPYALPVERCYGAAFMYNFSLKDDVLMYIIGGEDFGGEPKANNFIYSIKNNDYGKSAYHPRGRAYVEPLDIPRTRLIGFTLTTGNGEIMHIIGMGDVLLKGTSQRAINIDLSYYDVNYDQLTTKPETNEDDGQHIYTWKTLGSLSKDGSPTNSSNATGFSETIAVKINDENVIIGTGERPDGEWDNSFYQVWIDNNLYMVSRKLPNPPEEFTPRKNAAAFHLKYEQFGASYDKFYVGTGVDKNGNLLNDFWSYDISNSTWSRIRDCSNIARQGAVGFTVLRVDDLVRKGAEPQQRGIIAFGKGRQLNSSETQVRNDVWEYLP